MNGLIEHRESTSWEAHTPAGFESEGDYFSYMEECSDMAAAEDAAHKSENEDEV